jgi:iron complex transport system substrate-binding protein
MKSSINRRVSNKEDKLFKRFTAGIVIISLLLAGLIGCNNETEKETPAQNEFTDQAGRVIHLNGVPQKIVSMAPSNTEILFALGLGDEVVGVTDYCDYPPEAKEKTHIGGYWTPDVETIVSLAPDLVVAQSLHEAEVIPQLEKHGLTAVVLEPKTIDQVLDAITLVGEITGKTKEAASLTKEMRTRVDKVTGKTKGLAESQRPKVFYLTWHDPLITVGHDNLGEDLITKAGGTNIFHNLEGSPTVSLEDLIQADPDVIIAGIGMGTGADMPLQFARDESRLAGTSARQNNRVYSVSIDLAGRPGPRIVDALELFMAAIHPELSK